MIRLAKFIIKSLQIINFTRYIVYYSKIPYLNTLNIYFLSFLFIYLLKFLRYILFTLSLHLSPITDIRANLYSLNVNNC